MPPKRELPSKESALFKQVLRQYEHKQYKKGLKNVEQILKKVPDHGESMAMKGLFLNHLDQKESAYECVKAGVRNDLMSPICWHVYGLLYRSDKNYEEAMKCYRYALRYDPENLQVLRDFSVLQIHMRDYEGFNETKQKLLTLRSNQLIHWIGLAVSYHLLGNHTMAYRILGEYEKTIKDREEGKIDYDLSELILYKIDILLEQELFKEALEELEKQRSQICDPYAPREIKGNTLLKLNRLDEALKIYADLLNDNPDSRQYLEGYLQASGITVNSKYSAKVVKLLLELSAKYPRSSLLKRFLLDYAIGETFYSLVEKYFRSMFQKGVPSLFAICKTLYSDSEKLEMIGNVVEKFYHSLKETGKMSPSDSDPEPPTTLIWVTYYLAQHYDYLGRWTESIQLLNDLIDHTPILLDLYMMKARIYKHSGDLESAAYYMNEARKLDLQDRFINTKATRYYLRNNEIEEAEKTIALFAKQGTHEEKMQDLVDMQCLWFAVESGESHLRQNNYEKALNQFREIARHFDVIMDDQFDFHTYCLRKMTLSLLKFEDNLYGHPFYLRIAKGAASICLGIYDTPDKYKPKHEEPKANGNLSESEKKKMQAKQNKEKAKEAADKKDDKEKLKNKDANKPLPFENPLAELQKTVRPMQEHASSCLETHILTFELAIRQNKILVALKAVLRALTIGPNHHDTHRIQLHFWDTVSNLKEPLQGEIKTIVEEQKASLFKKTQSDSIPTALLKLNETALAHAKSTHDAELILAVVDAKKRYFNQPNCTDLLVQFIQDAKKLATVSTVFTYLSSIVDDSKLSPIRSKCHERFPLSRAFMNETQLNQREINAHRLAEKKEREKEEAGLCVEFDALELNQ